MNLVPLVRQTGRRHPNNRAVMFSRRAEIERVVSQVIDFAAIFAAEDAAEERDKWIEKILA